MNPVFAEFFISYNTFSKQEMHLLTNKFFEHKY